MPYGYAEVDGWADSVPAPLQACSRQRPARLRSPVTAYNPELPYGSSARTISFWLYTRSSTWTTNQHGCFEYGSPAVREIVGVGFARENNLYPRIAFAFYSDDLVVDPGVPEEGWFHFAGVYDGNRTAMIYINGQPISPELTTGDLLNTAMTSIWLGRSKQSSQWFDGLMDEVAIFNRDLSQAELQAIVDAGSLGMCKDADGWVDVTHNQYQNLPVGSYVQVRVVLRGDGSSTPSLRSLSLGYAEALGKAGDPGDLLARELPPESQQPTIDTSRLKLAPMALGYQLLSESGWAVDSDQLLSVTVINQSTGWASEPVRVRADDELYSIIVGSPGDSIAITVGTYSKATDSKATDSRTPDLPPRDDLRAAG